MVRNVFLCLDGVDCSACSVSSCFAANLSVNGMLAFDGCLAAADGWLAVEVDEVDCLARSGLVAGGCLASDGCLAAADGWLAVDVDEVDCLARSISSSSKPKLT